MSVSFMLIKVTYFVGHLLNHSFHWYMRLQFGRLSADFHFLRLPPPPRRSPDARSGALTSKPLAPLLSFWIVLHQMDLHRRALLRSTPVVRSLVDSHDRWQKTLHQRITSHGGNRKPKTEGGVEAWQKQILQRMDGSKGEDISTSGNET